MDLAKDMIKREETKGPVMFGGSFAGRNIVTGNGYVLMAQLHTLG
jgi:hypothetical protein